MGICDAPEPPDTSRFAEANAEIAARMADIMEQQHAWAKETGERGLAMAENYYSRIGRPMAEFNFDNMVADRQRYETLYQPREAQYLAEVDKFLQPEYQERLAAKAGSQTAQAFEAQRKNAEQRLTALGVDPSQGRRVQDKTSQIAEAAAVADSMNSARQGAEQFGVSALGDTVNIGRGLPSQSVALGQQALSAGQSGSGTFNAAAGNAANMAGTPGQWGGLALQGNTGAAGIYNNLGQSRLAAHQTPLLDIVGGAAGTAAGVYLGKAADGGEVPGLARHETGTTQVRQPVPSTAFAMDTGATGVYGAQPNTALPAPATNVLTAPDGGLAMGPGDGSGIDDQISARVSAGEYIIPADVVRRKGTDFFDKLIEKNHTPAAVQQAMATGHGGAMAVPVAQAPMGQASPLAPAVGGMATPGLS